MFSIGEFARHGRVSVRMLRHYDAIGLLQPACVDPVTGYRFYRAGQLADLNRVIALKDLGFPLQQVQGIHGDQVSAAELRGMLRLRRAEIRAQIDAETTRLGRVEARLLTIEDEARTPVDGVIVKRLPQVRLAGTAAGYEPDAITPVIQPLYCDLWGLMAAAGVAAAGPAVAYYQDTPDGDGAVVVHAAVPVGHRVPKSAVSVLVVAGQLYFTAVYSGLMLIVYRSRPDIEAADPAASTLRYRRFLAVITRALLTLVTLIDTTLLLVALPDWQVYRLSGIGRALPVLPFAAGVLLLGAVAARAGQGGSRLNGNVRGLAPAAGTDRDDDRFWKAGLLYVNRDDPALVVGARFGVGWTPNFGNLVAWLLIAGTFAAWAGLAVLGAAAGM
jgi:DNA-binding transcriptional MerR regulator